MIDVFAVEETSAQVCWRSLPARDVAFVAGDRRVEVSVPDADGPGAIDITGLAPAGRVDLVAEAEGGRRRVATFATLPSPGGDQLSRIATISDLHLGEPWFGIAPRIRDSRRGRDRYPFQCAQAAIAEAVGWGADALVVKGDITWSARPAQWRFAAELLDGVPIPVHAIVGNHDDVPKGVDATDLLEDVGVHVVRDAEAVDLPGVRLVFAATAAGPRGGRLPEPRRRRVVELAAEGAGRVIVVMHHYPDRFPMPTRYPPGIDHADAVPFLDELDEAAPGALITCGHTHRHRRRRYRSLEIVEVGSTKDHPGVIGGYAVHGGGVRQVVRRVTRPDVLAWTDRTGRSVAGLWGPWAAGRRRWRCFTHRWITTAT